MIDAPSERSEQGRFLRNSPGSSNAVLCRAQLFWGHLTFDATHLFDDGEYR
jgi:hypothetical protein